VRAYELYLLVHVGGAAVWVGSAFLMVVLLTRAVHAGDVQRTSALAGDSEWLGVRLFLPANLVVLVSAILLVEEGGFGWSRLWVVLGIAGFAASLVLGMAVFAPGWKRVAGLVRTEGADAPAVREWTRRLLLFSRADVGLLLGVVVVMVAKPTADDTGALALTAAIPLAVGAVALVLFRAESEPEDRPGTPEAV